MEKLQKYRGKEKEIVKKQRGKFLFFIFIIYSYEFNFQDLIHYNNYIIRVIGSFLRIEINSEALSDTFKLNVHSNVFIRAPQVLNVR